MATAVDAVGEFAAGVPTPLFQTHAMAGFTTFGFGVRHQVVPRNP